MDAVADAEAAQHRATAFARVGNFGDAVDAGLVAERLLRSVPLGVDTAARLQLSSVLTDLAYHLSQNGNHGLASTKATEAVDIRRQIFAGDLTIGALYLNSINALAIALSGAGRIDEALAATLEGVTAARDLLPLGLVDEKSLGLLLHTLSNRFAKLGRSHEALAASLEALDLYRQAALADPADRAQLVKTLGIVAEDLWDTGDRERAVALSTEAVDVCRHLAAESSERFEPLLVTRLKRNAHFLMMLEREDAATSLLAEVIARLERRGSLLVGESRDLAGTYLDLSAVYLGREAWTQARDASARSAAIFRGLAEQDRRHLPQFGDALGNLASALAASGNVAEAAPIAVEAWAIRRVIAQVTRDPNAYIEMAMAAYNASVFLDGMGQLSDALDAAEATLDAFRLAGEPVPDFVGGHLRAIAARISSR